MKINRFPILNMTCYDKQFDNNFTIIFEKLGTKGKIFELDVGSFNKNGRLLNLEETHIKICRKETPHDICTRS